MLGAADELHKYTVQYTQRPTEVVAMITLSGKRLCRRENVDCSMQHIRFMA